MRDSAVIALQSELALATERAAEAERSLARERQALEVASATLAQPLKYYLDTIRSRDTQVLAAERAAAQLRVNAAASEKGLELARVRIAALEVRVCCCCCCCHCCAASVVNLYISSPPLLSFRLLLLLLHRAT
jgi:hypothetical protein|tara:strand:+ start:183 stop:581 length:399 start_codon:yes stop_codon:yes gene_type:complete